MKSIETERKLPSQLKNVPLAKMRVSSNSQRDLRPSRVEQLVNEFDLDDFGTVIVSQREGFFWIVDGQHRIAALKQWLGKWEDQNVECRVYTGLTERQEADMFDRLNNQLAVRMFDKFKVRVSAGRPTEVAVKKLVEKRGLRISSDKTKEGAVSAVGALVKVYNRAGPEALSRALGIAHGSFGDPGLSSILIDGVSRLCERYNGALDDAHAVDRLVQLRGGIGALISRADVLKKQTRRPMPECVAAAVVDILNSKRGGAKLPSWWTTSE